MTSVAVADVSLFAQGEKVFLPSLDARGTSSSTGHQYSSRNSGQFIPSPEAHPKVNTLFSRKPGDCRDLLSSQLGDLSKTLTFSEDAVCSLGPDTRTTYASAKEDSRGLFSHHTIMGIRTQRFKGVGTIGRHDVRGSGKKHLMCNLTASSECNENKSKPRRKVERKPSAGVPNQWEDYNPPQKDFGSELATGAKPLFQRGRERSTILLDNSTLFKKVLQTTYPQPPEEYRLETTKEIEVPFPDHTPVHFQQGHLRWVDFPQLIEASAEHPLECRSVGSSAHLTSLLELSEQQSSLISLLPEKQEFFKILKEWSGAWKLHIILSEVCIDTTLLQDLRSVCDQTKMYAIAIVSMLAENEAMQSLKVVSRSLFAESHDTPVWMERKVSSEIVWALERLLDDEEVHVRVPSAITLYSMDTQTEKAEEVLHAVVSEGRVERGQIERWCAAQCLVCAGIVSASVISQLLYHLLDSHGPAEQARATQLLATASKNTNLVHSMVADQLNNSGWQERLASCKVLPLLHNQINKDMCTKLLQLAWEDWSPEVQHGAAQALGKTSHGKMIHDDIVIRLSHDSVLVRLDAIRKLHSLQLMTSKLLPAYLACFKDKHLSIRLEAVSLTGSLKLKHQYVMQALKEQLRDNCWMLRAATLRALASIGECDEELTEQLMWVVRFDKMATVRAEACRTIARLRLREERMIKALKELATVEDEEEVVKQATQTLVELGYREEVQDEMMLNICDTVRRLGTKDAIVSDVIAAETATITDYGMNRPTNRLAVRDYLDDKQRYLAYSGVSATKWTDPSVWSNSGGSSLGSKPRPRAHTISEWTPDKKTINAMLDKMRNRVHSQS